MTGLSRQFSWPQATLSWSVVTSLVCISLTTFAQDQTGENLTGRFGLLEAVRITLAQDPVIRLQQKEVQFSRGKVQEAKGLFDARLSSSLSQSLEHSAVQSSTNGLNPGGFQRLTVDRTTYSTSLDKLLRSGVEVSPGVQLTRVDDGLSGFDPENRAAVNFTVRVPLGRGLGRKDTAAEETAARISYEAVRLDLRNVIALRVLNTTASYWSYVAAARRLQIVTRSEQQARELVDNTEALIKANEVPAAEMNQLNANLADKTANRLAGEQELFEARQNLGLAMGLAFERIAVLASPADEFPPASEPALPAGLTPQQLIGEAFNRRADLLSARLRERSTKTVYDAARRRLKPKVDLLLQAGYAGVESGTQAHHYFSSFGEHVEGVNAFAGVSFEWPPANNAARGVLLQQESAYEQSAIRTEELTRTISSGVTVALERLRSVVQELKKTGAAIQEYQTAVENEKVKRQLGLSTFINVTLLEDRLTSAALANLSALLQHAIALARLRYETGWLFSVDETGETIRWEQLTTVPTVQRPPEPKTKP